MWRNLALSSVLLLICIARPAFAQFRPPTDTELKATYCLGISQAQLQAIGPLDDLVRNAPPSEAKDKALQQHRDIEQRLARLRAYILPRLGSVDAVALKVASDRAATDIRLAEDDANRLSAACRATSATTEAEAAAVLECVQRASPTEVSTRMKSCNDTSWLPF
jgi:hypothetical protein